MGTKIIKKNINYRLGDNYYYDRKVDSISIDRHLFHSGLQLSSHQGLFDSQEDFAYFWLNKQYEKISFIVGPHDNISSHASTWLVIKGDKDKILYEEIVRQTDLPRQVVVNVSGQDRICFTTELRGCDFLGGITFGVVDMWAYTKADLASVPKEGLVNPNKEKLAALPSPCPLISKIPSFSYHGKAHPDAVIFNGKSRHLTFSMGGEKFNQGLIFTTGANLWNDNIDCYFMFDLGGEFDYLSFYAGMLTKKRALADDSLRIYADGKLILDTIIHCAWPNQYFEIPINKCRKLTFAKTGNGTLNKDCYICLGDLAVYRGKPVKGLLHGRLHQTPLVPHERRHGDLQRCHARSRQAALLRRRHTHGCCDDGVSGSRKFAHELRRSGIHRGYSRGKSDCARSTAAHEPIRRTSVCRIIQYLRRIQELHLHHLQQVRVLGRYGPTSQYGRTQRYTVQAQYPRGPAPRRRTLSVE